MVDESGSVKTEAASSKVTPCLRRLILALTGSHSIVTFIVARFYIPSYYPSPMDSRYATSL